MNNERSTPHVFLIGFMRVGKTTVGRDLADRLGVPFYDLDERIENLSGREIPEIFEKQDEATFRKIETGVLEDIAGQPPGIVAAGGGTFTYPRNKAIIRSSGVSVWLDAPTETILERGETGARRPLWAGEEDVRALLEKRLPHYREADLHLRLDTGNPAVATDQLVKLLESHRLP
jgi:shikimate kinase